MALKYESDTAHKLISDISNTNDVLISTGNRLVRLRNTIKNTESWKDKKHIECYDAICSALTMIGKAIDNQNNYKSQMQKAIEILEGN